MPLSGPLHAAMEVPWYAILYLWKSLSTRYIYDEGKLLLVGSDEIISICHLACPLRFRWLAALLATDICYFTWIQTLFDRAYIIAERPPQCISHKFTIGINRAKRSAHAKFQLRYVCSTALFKLTPSIAASPIFIFSMCIDEIWWRIFGLLSNRPLPTWMRKH